MQRRHVVAPLVHCLNQEQLRFQNLPGGKAAVGRHQVCRLLQPVLQTRQIRRSAVGAIAAGALLVPASASADDQSIFNLWHQTRPTFQHLRRDFERGERRWENSSYRKPGKALAAARKTSRLAHKTNGSLGKKTTPAMAAGLTDHVWTLEEIAGLLDSN